MQRSWLKVLCRAVCGLSLLVFSVPAGALEPPTPEQVRQYKADGTWEQRVAAAHALGNDRVAPSLIAHFQARLRRDAAKATGLPPPTGTDEPALLPPSGWQGALPASGSPKVLVLLIDFPDYPHGPVQTVADVQNKCFGDGDPARFPSDSLRNYYQRSSYNQLTIQGNVLGWYTAAHNRGYYWDEASQTGVGREALIKEALNYYNDPAHGGHDFTQYDNDGNGQIDSFLVKWTGPIGAWASFWWAYATGWGDSSYRIDGKSLGGYVWSWIAGSSTEVYDPGTDIHETGHSLGLPDLYDYDDSVGPRGGVGGWDVMDGYGDHNCFSKYLLGWLTPAYIVNGSQTLALNPTGTSQDCVLIMPSSAYTPPDWFDEFYMVQYRRRVGNDSNYPTDGYFIWHIDSTGGFAYNNSYTAHKLVRLMEADGLEDIEAGRGGNAGDFYRSPKSFGPWTFPNSRDYTGVQTGVQVDQLGTAGATLPARFSIVPVPNVSPAGTTVTTESAWPPNGAVDNQEIVTVSFSLRNIGTGDTADLVATLEATGGVTLPSASQDYGVLSVGGPAVSRSFTFVATGACPGTLTATLHLVDAGTTIDPAVFTLPIGAAVRPLVQDFDSVTAPTLPAGWVADRASGSVAPWATSTTRADTAPNSAFTANSSGVSDSRLVSPTFAITTPTAQLTFRHFYDVEYSYDACVLEIAIGAGGFQDILTAGGSFVTGGYMSSFTVPSAFGNPLAGRQGWTGGSSSFITTTVNLPAAAAGQNVRLRWRIGTDNSAAGSGWYVDGVSVFDGYICAAPQPGDFDADGDADQEDFGRLQVCLTSNGAPVTDLACYPGRLDADNDVDQSDVAIFQKCHTQPGALPPADCQNP